MTYYALMKNQKIIAVKKSRSWDDFYFVIPDKDAAMCGERDFKTTRETYYRRLRKLGYSIKKIKRFVV